MSNVPLTLQRDDFDRARVRRLMGETSVAVVVPARNEAVTIGSVLEAVLADRDVIYEVVVVNDHSNDDTATVAHHHGARVIAMPGEGGKGNAMAVGLAATTSDIVVFLDADVLNTGSDYVARLVQPLVESPEIELVKGYYERPLHNMPTGGGRVTELTARPILSLLYPGLGEIRQPLAGETAGRRTVFDAITLEPEYGVEIALLIDVAAKFGVRSLAQVDLGTRRHRNRPLDELRPMAVDVLLAALNRYGVDVPPKD